MHSFKFILFTFTILLFNIPDVLLAQTKTTFLINHKHISVQEGLSNRTVNCVTQDKKGVIWIGTDNGLNKYDGYQSKQWTKAIDSLPFNRIHDIYEDENQQLWLFNASKEFGKRELYNIEVFDPQTEMHQSLQKYLNVTLPFKFSEVNRYFETSNHELIFSTSRGHWRYGKEGNFSKLNIPLVLVLMAENSNGHYFGSLNNRLVQIDEEGNIRYFEKDYKEIARIEILDNDNIAVFFTLTSHEDELITPEQFGVILSLENGNVQETEIKGFSFLRDRANVSYDAQRERLWVSDGKNFIVYNKKGELVYKLEEPIPGFLVRNIRDHYVDRNGCVWFSTRNGIYLLELKENQFKRYLHKDLKGGKALEEIISCRGIVKIGDELIVNTHSGTRAVNLQTREVEKLSDFLPESERNKFNANPFFVDENNLLWSATRKLIRQSSDANLQMKTLAIDTSQLNRKIWSILNGQNSILWLGTDMGLLYYDRKTNLSELQVYKASNGFDLEACFILQIIELDMDHLLISTDNGLLILNLQSGFVERYSAQDKGVHFLPATKFQYVHKDKEGVLWLGTDGGGLIRWDRKSNTYKQFSQKDGFSNNNIYSIIEDENNFLWLSSDYGIMQFDKASFEMQAFFEKDGISHYEFNRISSYKDEEGMIYFGGLNGVTAFDPNDFLKDRTRNNNLDLDLTVFAKKGWWQKKFETISKDDDQKYIYALDHDERDVRLEFNTFDYLHKDDIVFYYRLEGRGQDWNQLNGNQLILNEIRRGQMELSVIAKEKHRLAISKPLKVTINVSTPFIHSIWFVTLCSILLCLLIWGVHEWRVAQLRKRKLNLEKEVLQRTEQIQRQAEEVKQDKQTIELQAEELKDLDKAKSRFFANISHELRTPLSLILAPLDQLIRKKNIDKETQSDLQIMQLHGKQLIGRIEELLDLSRMEANQLTLKKEPVFIIELLKEQIATFKPFASQKNIRLSFEYDAASLLCVYVDQEKLRKIQGNLISNALRYTNENGEVKISFTDLGNELKFEVLDNGIGIHADDLPHIFERFYKTTHTDNILGGTGIGLSLSKELAELMDAKIEVNSEWGKGSCFALVFKKIEIINDRKTDDQIGAKNAYPFADETRLGSDDFFTINRSQAPRILIAEDNVDLSNFLAKELKNYQVNVAKDGAEAIEILSAVKSDITNPKQPSENRLPDLIISDIMMPHMDGFELLKRLKSNMDWQKIPVIMLTARTNQADKLQALRIGVDDYMTKPFLIAELKVRIDNLLSHAFQRAIPEVKEENFKETPIIEHKESQEWLKKVEGLVLDQINAYNFTLDKLAADLFISKRQLQRKLKAYTGLTANLYIREIRLHHARQLLEEGKVETLSELSYAVGFSDPHYFSTLFKKRYGKKPLEFIVQ